jgi:cyclophilin family peptidyl-prolyl cis-trans isomerase
MVRFRGSALLIAVALMTSLVVAACGEDEGLGSAPTQTQATPTEEGTTQMQWNTEPAMQLEEGKNYGAIIRTTKGDIVVDLFESEAPRTVNNFVFLANQGYYENVSFHRIIKDFMVQTGDPTGTGAGGPGYRFADEPVTRPYVRGTLAMANAGPNTNGSQFFIVHADAGLPPNYTIFGIVTEGLDVLDAIANVPVRPSSRGEMSVPTEPVSLTGVEITTN